MPGPVPKRSNQRRRRNKPDVPIDTALGAADVEIPEADPDWHHVATRWYEALARSAQSFYYEPSDWAYAYVQAESLSRDLKEQFVGISEVTGRPITAIVPINGARMNAFLKANTALMATEGDRRRARLEIERPKSTNEGDNVAWLDQARRRSS